MCASKPGKRERRVSSSSRSDRIVQENLISGGGRLQFTNLHTTAENLSFGQPPLRQVRHSRAYTPAASFASSKTSHRVSREKLAGFLRSIAASDIVASWQQKAAMLEWKFCSTQNQEVRKTHQNQFTVQAGGSVSTPRWSSPRGFVHPKIGATPFG